MSLSEPSSQNSTPRVCSASAEVITTKEVSAENSSDDSLPMWCAVARKP
ncbi:hypothetical protein [Streptomyces sp. NPDC088184]